MNTETPNRGPNPAQMKAVGLKISFMMALWMSFTLSIFVQIIVKKSLYVSKQNNFLIFALGMKIAKYGTENVKQSPAISM